MNLTASPSFSRLLSLLLLSAGMVLAVREGPAQVKPDKSEIRDFKRELLADPAPKKSKKGGRDESRSARPSPGEADARALARIREHLDVPDDAEWSVVAERVSEVVAARAALGLPVSGFKGSPSGGDKGKRGASDQNTLRSALRDQLPDAEIKARLDRAHEDFERKQARVNQAHANLRAVLTVRQEAVAVVAGLLPP